MKEKIIGLIPARMGSSRFPGKPIVNICGKPMVYWVYNQATKVKEIDEIYVVTEDDSIAEKCREFGIPVWVEREETSTAAEKLSYAARRMDGDIPLLEPRW